MSKMTHCPRCGERTNVSATILDFRHRVAAYDFKPVAVILNPGHLDKLVEEMGTTYYVDNVKSGRVEFAGLRLKLDDEATKIRIEVEV